MTIHRQQQRVRIDRGRLHRAHRVAGELQSGYEWISGSSRHYWGLSFRGVKSSGVGREESVDELLSYTGTTAVTVVTE